MATSQKQKTTVIKIDLVDSEPHSIDFNQVTLIDKSVLFPMASLIFLRAKRSVHLQYDCRLYFAWNEKAEDHERKKPYRRHSPNIRLKTPVTLRSHPVLCVSGSLEHFIRLSEDTALSEFIGSTCTSSVKQIDAGVMITIASPLFGEIQEVIPQAGFESLVSED